MGMPLLIGEARLRCNNLNYDSRPKVDSVDNSIFENAFTRAGGPPKHSIQHA